MQFCHTDDNSYLSTYVDILWKVDTSDLVIIIEWVTNIYPSNPPNPNGPVVDM